MQSLSTKVGKIIETGFSDPKRTRDIKEISTYIRVMESKGLISKQDYQIPQIDTVGKRACVYRSN